jgi:hypothetical protein
LAVCAAGGKHSATAMSAPCPYARRPESSSDRVHRQGADGAGHVLSRGGGNRQELKFGTLGGLKIERSWRRSPDFNQCWNWLPGG